MEKKTRTIKVDYLARVEGEGALFIDIEDNKLKAVQLKIFEPPRFFESFMRGKNFEEAPDITARICGICPVAYQMSSVHAMEQILGLQLEHPLRELRRLLYCGEWIESHMLHMLMLHAPDFLGMHDVMDIAKEKPELVKKGLKAKKIGNDIVNLVGGREIHPINVRIGGFYKVFEKSAFKELRDNLAWARDAVIELIEWMATFPMPDYEQEYLYVCLSHPDEYPFNEGQVISSEGLSIESRDYEKHFQEFHVEHSNALHSYLMPEKRSYLVGPMARYNLCFDRLTPLCKEIAKKIGLPRQVNNPFQSILVRGIETLYAFEEAIRVIDEYQKPKSPFQEYRIVAGEGFASTEAPRGLLYHHYKIDNQGKIETAKIVPPTSQNQKRIEDDLSGLVEKNMQMETDDLQWQCEQAVRNYDPCISCATHFLKMKIRRR
jgi:coenzyme F420-reducing hydrogenase alpha subunit